MGNEYNLVMSIYQYDKCKTSFPQHIIANTKGLYPTSSRAIATMFELQVPIEKLDKLNLVLYKVAVIKSYTSMYKGAVFKKFIQQVTMNCFCRIVHRGKASSLTQPAITYSKLTIETLEKGVKYVQI